VVSCVILPRLTTGVNGRVQGGGAAIIINAMNRLIGVVIVVASVGGGAYWMSQREAARSRAHKQQRQQELQRKQPGDPLQRGEGAESGAARGEDKVAGLGPRGQAPDERHPRHHTAQQLRADSVKAAGRRQELIKHIRKAGEEPEGEDEGDVGKAVLGKEQIRSAIKAITPLVQTCYEKRLAQKKDLAGKAVIKFTIVAKDGKGSLDEGEIKSSTLGDLRLDTCMLHALTKARFPLPEGEGKVTVNYPFKFRPRSK
jgi:hypothetical protein